MVTACELRMPDLLNMISLKYYLKPIIGIVLISISLQSNSSVKPNLYDSTGTTSLGDALLNVQSDGQLYVDKGDYDFVEIFIINSTLNKSSMSERTRRAETLSAILKTYRQKISNYSFIRGVLIEFLDESISLDAQSTYDTIDHFLYSYDESFNQSPTACPDLNKNDLTGLWRGKKSFPEDDNVQIWTNERKSDQSFEITFYEKDSGTIESIEKGTWSVEGCILKNKITELNGENFIFMEKYQINNLSSSSINYTSFRSNNTYEMSKEID